MKFFKANAYTKSVHDIDYAKLREQNVRLLCFDLDNTLDKPDRLTEQVDLQITELLEGLRKEFDILIVSNNKLEGRVESFASKLDLPYVEAMNKPFQKSYKNNEIINKYGKENIVFIGDKIVTDVIGANIFGSRAILVDPLHPKSKKWYAFMMSVVDGAVWKLSNMERQNYFSSMELEND